MVHFPIFSQRLFSANILKSATNAAATLLLFFGVQNVQAQTLQTNIYNANATFAVPAGVTQINVEAWGGGGAGGGSGVENNSGSGGGAGGYLLKNNITVTPVSNHAIVVGANGDGFSPGSGTPGLSSTVTSLGLTAFGGGGGATNGGAFGVGGSASGGTTNLIGGNGVVGGGSVGGKGGNGPTVNGGLGGNGGANANGFNGAVPGGGGGGGEFSGNKKGGAGGKGRVIVSYYLPPTFTSFSPANGCPGTMITITGTNFIGITNITFNGTPAPLFTVVSATQINVTIPAGATSGVVNISRPSGFVNTTSFTVNPSPVIGPISGNSTTCVSNTIALSHPDSGGTWTSSSPSIATVDASTGVVTGISTGSTTITYTVNVGGCIVTATKTITIQNALAVLAPTAICIGTTAQLSPASGGTWTSSNNSLATVDSATGLVSAIAQGTVNFTFTDGTCSSTTSNVAINATPVIVSQPIPTQIACNGGFASFSIVASGGSLTYQWYKGTTALGNTGSISGANTTMLMINPVTPADVSSNYYCVVSNSCSVTATSNNASLTINYVTASVISGSQQVCTEDPTAFTVSTAATGSGTLSYQWQSNTTGCSGVWTTISGATGSTFDPPVNSQTTYYRVMVISTLNSVQCSATSNCLVVTNNTKTWSGAVNNNWNIAGNWLPSGIPSSQNCVVIPNSIPYPIISGSGITANAKNLSVLSGGRLDVNPSNTIVVQNFVNVNPLGNFYITNNASLVQTDNVQNVGNVVMQRISQPMYRYDYTYWNSPMKLGAYTLGDLSPATQVDKYYSWTPTLSGGNGNWKQESAATIMDPAKGYIVRAPQTYSTNPALTQPYAATFIGTPNNGDIIIPIAIGTLGASTNNDKMNLIGNPFPSAVDADLFLNAAGNASVIDGTIYFWTHHTPPSTAFANPFYGTFAMNYSANGYASYNTLGGTNTVPAGFGGTPPNGSIAAGQGFFVKGLANGSVVFTNSMREIGNNNVFFRVANDDSEILEKHRIWLNLADTSGSFSQILVGYANGATNDHDRRFDGESMDNNPVVFYSINSTKNYAIQGLALPFNDTETVALGFKCPAANTFTIGIDHLDGLFETQEIYLEDKLLNIIHDIKASSYSFSTEMGTFNNRFVLRYNGNALGVNNPHTGTGLIAFVKDKNIFIESSENIDSVDVYDISGKLVKTYSVEATNRFDADFIFENGIYLAKIKFSNGVTSSVKLINN